MSIPSLHTPVILLPNCRSLRLFEAITAIAFGHVLDPGTRQERLALLASEYLDLAASAEFPSNLVDPPPLETLRDKLHEYHGCGRPTWSELYGLVCEQIAINSKRRPGTILDGAVTAFHHAAFAGHVKLTGKLNGSSDDNHREIPHSYFGEPRGIYWRSNEIRKSDSLFKTVYARKDTKPTDEFFDVLVDRSSFQAWLSAMGYEVVVEPTSQETSNAQLQTVIAVPIGTGQIAVEPDTLVKVIDTPASAELVELPAPAALVTPPAPAPIEADDGEQPEKQVNSAQRESTKLADEALWGDAGPVGLTNGQRDGKIQDWQREQGMVVVSPRTIARHFKDKSKPP
jgi:hypothetical protein